LEATLSKAKKNNPTKCGGARFNLDLWRSQVVKHYTTVEIMSQIHLQLNTSSYIFVFKAEAIRQNATLQCLALDFLLLTLPTYKS